MWEAREGVRLGAWGAAICVSLMVLPARAQSNASEPVSTKVALEFTADHGNAALEVHREQSGAWRSICLAPCRRGLDPGASYRVRGDSIYPSDAFYLPVDHERVRLHAEVATKGARTFNAILAVGGGLMALNGLGFLAAGAIMKSSSEDIQGFESGGDTVLVIGGVMLGVGAIAGIYGLVNLFDKTEVQMSDQPMIPGRPVQARLALPLGLAATPEGIVF